MLISLTNRDSEASVVVAGLYIYNIYILYIYIIYTHMHHKVELHVAWKETLVKGLVLKDFMHPGKRTT